MRVVVILDKPDNQDEECQNPSMRHGQLGASLRRGCFVEFLNDDPEF